MINVDFAKILEAKNPWLAAKKLKLVRYYDIDDEEVTVESGVNFFVLAIEYLGGITYYSCEGHAPNYYDFYLCFDLKYPLVDQLVKICQDEASWSYMWNEEKNHCIWRFAMMTEEPITNLKEHQKHLALLAKRWRRAIKTLDLKEKTFMV